MNYVDRLVEGLKQQLAHPWTTDKSGGERVWFLVYSPDKMRNIIARTESFRLVAEEAGKRWEQIDLSRSFGAWMGKHRYAARYYAKPGLATTVPADFAKSLAEDVVAEIRSRECDERTLLAITGTEALYGILKLSHFTRTIEEAVVGRLLVFFPGEYSEPQYRFLDARDGWNYLAIPIVPVSGRGST